MKILKEMINQKQTLEEKFLSDLRGSRDPKLFIYWNLFSILHLGDPKFLDYMVEEYKKEPSEGWWFLGFHKALRQCDYFSSSLCLSESKISPDESKRLNAVLLQRSRIRGEHNKNGINESEILNEEYIQLGLELKSLKSKQNIHERTSISGHLDSILYECISNGGDELFNFMSDFLKMNIQLETEES